MEKPSQFKKEYVNSRALLVNNPMQKVSIIMPVYGVESYIAKAIESVLSQTYSDWQLVIVNDGTIDRSREIAKKYADIDERIQIIDKENGGLSDARNFGLQYADGEYVHFFDSDDWIEPDFFEKLVTTIEVNDLDVAVCGYFVDTVDEEGNLTNRSERSNLSHSPKSKQDYFERMEYYLNYAWNKLYRRSFLIYNRLIFEKGLWLMEDSEFISRVLNFNPKVGYIDYAGYHYINRPDITLSKKYNENVFWFMKRKMRLYHPVLLSIGASPSIVNAIYEEMRAYTSVYLFKQMMKSLTIYEFKLHSSNLYNDQELNPRNIPLNNCRTVKDKMILILAKMKMVYLLHLIGQRVS